MVRNKLSGNWSFVARFLRLIPLTWKTWPCLRMEVYGRGKILHLFHDYKQIKKRHYNRGGTNKTIDVVGFQWTANVIVEDLGPNLLGAIGDQIQEISGQRLSPAGIIFVCKVLILISIGFQSYRPLMLDSLETKPSWKENSLLSDAFFWEIRTISMSLG